MRLTSSQLVEISQFVLDLSKCEPSFGRLPCIQDTILHDSRHSSPHPRHPPPQHHHNSTHDVSPPPQSSSKAPAMSTSTAASSSHLPLTRASVEAAHTLIQPHIHRTPVLTNTTLSNLASTPQGTEALRGSQWEGQDSAKPNVRLFFKCENFQRIGAFKVRGAFHAVIRLIEERGLEEVRKKGVVTHSSGTSTLLL